MSETCDFRDEPTGRGAANVKCDEWLKSYGFKIYCTLKHGPVFDVLSLLQDGWISRSKAAEAIAEMLLGNTPTLPDCGEPAFDDLELPGETVVKLRRELDSYVKKLDQALKERDAARIEATDHYAKLKYWELRAGELMEALAPFANHQSERLAADRTHIIHYSPLSDEQWRRALEVYTHE